MTLIPRRKRLGILAITLVCLASLWLRAPYVSTGLPYFYDEDEAHHFNRVANMVKAGDYNPHYFRKPSLHFYLRMPVLAASFLWNVKEGHIRSVKEIVTKDSYGIADFAFSTSHPGIVKWSRVLSLLLSLGTVILTMLLAFELSASWFASALAGGLAAVSPDLLKYSSTVGVDVLMAFMCLLTVYYAVRASKSFTTGKLVICGLLAGLAVSSKYNAAPIAIIPLALLITQRKYDVKHIALALLAPILGFFIGSPYIPSELPLFLDHFGYEIWHYGIAGHEGHTAEPGITQFYFYMKWLFTSSLGAASLITALLGLVGYLRSGKYRLLFLAFPVLFIFLMSNQRANFTRNMIVVVPFFAVLTGLFLRKVLQLISAERNALFAASAAILFIVPLIQPLAQGIGEREDIISIPESRLGAESWLGKNRDKFNRVAIAGQLQFAPSIFQEKNISRINEEKSSLIDIYMQGFDLAIVSENFLKTSSDKSPSTVEANFVGTQKPLRILKNPSFSAVSFRGHEDFYKLHLQQEVASNPKYQVFAKNPKINSMGMPGSPCSNQADGSLDSNEPYCWISSKTARLQLGSLREVGQTINAEGRIMLYLELMSPWPDQQVELSVAGQGKVQFLISEPGKWQRFPFEIPYPILLENGALDISIAKIASPKEIGLNKDSRVLGLAIKDVSAGDF